MERLRLTLTVNSIRHLLALLLMSENCLARPNANLVTAM